MARGPKAEEGPVDGVPENFQILIGKRTLQNLLKDDGTYQQKISDLKIEMKAVLDNAVDNNHLHLPALRLLKKFRKMKAEDAAFLYYNFLGYMELSGELRRIESIRSFDFDDEETETKEAGSEENVRQLHAAE